MEKKEIKQTQRKKTFYVISRDFQDINMFSHSTIKAIDESKAWEIVQNEISGNMSQDWLLSIDEVNSLYKICKEILK